MGYGDSEDLDDPYDDREGASQDDDHFQGTQRSTVVQNQPHDEEVLLSESDSFAHDPPPAPRDASLIDSHDDMPSSSGRPQPPQQTTQSRGGAQSASSNSPPVQSQSNPSGGSGDDPPAYNPSDYLHLNVSEDVRQLFQYITRFTPKVMDLDTKLKPFIPDYIPAVGGIDEFIKVPRPDSKPDFLGLKVLDEPAAVQSDPTVLTLRLRQLSKESPGSKAEMVGRIDHTDDGKQKKIQQWINSITDIHKSKPPASISYSRRMPDIDTLMDVWPPEMESFLKTMRMPTGDIDVDLKTFAKMVCSLLDIPVHDNIMESLHVLFTLYLGFKTNPVFRQMFDLEDRVGGEVAQGSAPGADVWTA